MSRLPSSVLSTSSHHSTPFEILYCESCPGVPNSFARLFNTPKPQSTKLCFTFITNHAIPYRMAIVLFFNFLPNLLSEELVELSLEAGEQVRNHWRLSSCFAIITISPNDRNAQISASVVVLNPE